MVASTLKKLETLKAKKLKVAVGSKDYSEMAESLRNQNFAFDVKPGKGSSVIFIIQTKWKSQ